MSAAPAMTPENTFLAQGKLREQPLGRITWANNGGSPLTLDVRNVGYLHRLVLVQTLTGTYTTAGPTSADGMGQYAGPIGRVAVRSNSTGVLFDVTGFLAAIISAISNDYDNGNGTMNPSPGTFTASPGTSAFSNKWAYEIPIGIYLANYESPLGLYQTAIQGQETQIEIRWNSVAINTAAIGTGVYVGNSANLTTGPTAYADIQQVYYEPIDRKWAGALPNQSFVHTWTDTYYPLTADGDNEFRLPAANLYIRLVLVIVTGASAAALALDSTTVTRFRVVYGANVTPYDWTNDQLRYRMTKQYPGITFPAGTFVIDLLTETHTERDWLNSAASTELRLILTTSGGSYAGGAYLRVGKEQLVPYIVPTPGSVGVQGVN
jgi:hypothetical protein